MSNLLSRQILSGVTSNWSIVTRSSIGNSNCGLASIGKNKLCETKGGQNQMEQATNLPSFSNNFLISKQDSSNYSLSSCQSHCFSSPSFSMQSNAFTFSTRHFSTTSSMLAKRIYGAGRKTGMTDAFKQASIQSNLNRTWNTSNIVDVYQDRQLLLHILRLRAFPVSTQQRRRPLNHVIRAKLSQNNRLLQRLGRT